MDGLENPSSVSRVNHAQDAHATSSNVPGWSLRLNGCVAGTRQDAASTLKTSGSVEEAASLFIPGNSGCGRNGGRVFVPAIESTRGPKGPRFPFWAGVRACPPAIINGRVGKPVLHCRYESCARCACHVEQRAWLELAAEWLRCWDAAGCRVYVEDLRKRRRGCQPLHSRKLRLRA